MSCRITDNGQGMLFVCSRETVKYCKVCGLKASVLCDGPVIGGKTCDAPLCEKHAIRIASNKDLCPHCAAKKTGGLNSQARAKTSPPAPAELTPEQRKALFQKAANTVIPFGREYRRMTIDQIASTDKGLLYLDWGREAWMKWERPPTDILYLIGIYLDDPSIAKELQRAIAENKARRRADRDYMDYIAR